MFAQDTLSAFLDRAAGADPTPGGGAIASLAGALGNAMGAMTLSFTQGKKKYAEHEAELVAMQARFAEARNRLVALMDADAAAFDAVGAAYGMPKDDDAQKASRGEAIQAALAGAMAPPQEMMSVALSCLEELPRLAEIGNRNLVSDTGVSAILLEGAVAAAALNVRVNAVYLADKDAGRKAFESMESGVQRASELRRATEAAVCSAIGSV